MKTKFLVATALVVANFTPIAVAPAFAQVSSEVQAELTAYCIEFVVPPGQPAPFIITAENIVEGTFTPGGVVSTTFQAGSEHRHGGSPNIFGAFDVVTSGGTTDYTFDCQTRNPNAGGEGEFPAGLQ